jgi:hypothetical protein
LIVEAKMSIAESRSEAQTAMEPVSQPVPVLIKIKKAAARMESRAAEFLRLTSSAWTRADVSLAVGTDIKVEREIGVLRCTACKTATRTAS